MTARTFAGLVNEHDLTIGRVFPALSNIRAISLKIAVAVTVAQLAFNEGLANTKAPPDLEAAIAQAMYQPMYKEYV